MYIIVYSSGYSVTKYYDDIETLFHSLSYGEKLDIVAIIKT